MRKFILYEILFPNEKKYIGITSIGLKERKIKHFSKALKGSKLAVHRALNKYKGLEIWREIKEFDSFDELKKAEVETISKEQTLAPNGYNLTCGGDGTIGYKCSIERRKQISLTQKGRKSWNKGLKTGKLSENHKNKISTAVKKSINLKLRSFQVHEAIFVEKKHKKAIYKTGKFLGAFTNITEFSKEFKIIKQNICKVLLGKRCQAGGLTFKYL